MKVAEKLRQALLERVKSRGDNAYELCDPDDPEDGIEVTLPDAHGLSRLWYITSIKQEDGLWWAEVVPATPSVPPDEELLDNLPYNVLGAIMNRIENLERENNYHFTCDKCGYEWEEEYECAASDDCPECDNRHIEPDCFQPSGSDKWIPLVGDERNYLVVMEGDIEPVLHGPYHDDDTILAVAKRNRREEGDNNGLFSLRINFQTKAVEMFAFSGGDFNEDEE